MANTRPKLSELHKIVRANDYDLALFCIYGEVDRADALGKAPKDINIRDHRGMTPLHVAASIGNLEFTKLLIEAGANINGRDKVRSFTPSSSSSVISIPSHLMIIMMIMMMREK